LSKLDNYNILLVDDDSYILETLRNHLELEGAKIETAENGKVALEKLQTRKFDCIISDIRMPEMSGTDLLAVVRETVMPAPRMILMSAFTDLTVDGAKDLGAHGLYLKPQHIANLFELILDDF
jgi:YesN/AraC family two-component response regulator